MSTLVELWGGTKILYLYSHDAWYFSERFTHLIPLHKKTLWIHFEIGLVINKYRLAEEIDPEMVSTLCAPSGHKVSSTQPGLASESSDSWPKATVLFLSFVVILLFLWAMHFSQWSQFCLPYEGDGTVSSSWGLTWLQSLIWWDFHSKSANIIQTHKPSITTLHKNIT